VQMQFVKQSSRIHVASHYENKKTFSAKNLTVVSLGELHKYVWVGVKGSGRTGFKFRTSLGIQKPRKRPLFCMIASSILFYSVLHFIR
jgi:hypothetical protein